jgi:hypothetical protein
LFFVFLSGDQAVIEPECQIKAGFFAGFDKVFFILRFWIDVEVWGSFHGLLFFQNVGWLTAVPREMIAPALTASARIETVVADAARADCALVTRGFAAAAASVVALPVISMVVPPGT